MESTMSDKRKKTSRRERRKPFANPELRPKRRRRAGVYDLPPMTLDDHRKAGQRELFPGHMSVDPAIEARRAAKKRAKRQKEQPGVVLRGPDDR
jgi:hypothetical protein